MQSWNGDVEATAHISKIIGREKTLNDVWPDQKSVRIRKNWEAITLLLLHKKEKEDQEKNKMNQLKHFQQRYNFFQHTLLDHQHLIGQFGCYNPMRSVSRQSSYNQRQSKDLKRYGLNEMDSTPSTTDINNLLLENLLIQPAPCVKKIPVTNCRNLTNVYRVMLKRPVSAVVPKKQYMRNISRPMSAVSFGQRQKEKHENNNLRIDKMFQINNSVMVPNTSPVEKQVEQKHNFNVKELKQGTSITVSPHTLVFQAESFINARKPSLNGNLMGKRTHDLESKLGIVENSRVL